VFPVSYCAGALSGTLHYSYPRSAEEEAKTNNVWLKGHTGEPEILPMVMPREVIRIDAG